MRASIVSLVAAAAAAVALAASCAFPDFPFGASPDDAGVIDGAIVDGAIVDAGASPDGCASDCMGGGCVEGKCQPVVLYSDGDAGPGGIYVTDLGTVYFTQFYGGRVLREQPDGSVGVLATNLPNPVRVAGSAQGVFATASAGGDAAASAIVAVTGAGAPRRIVIGPTAAGLPIAPWGIVDIGHLLVWTNALPGGSVMMAAQDGTSVSVVAAGGHPQEIAANAEYAWWVDTDHSSLMRASLGGDGGAPVLVTPDFVDNVAYAAGHLYTASFTSTSSIGVIDDPIATGVSVRELVSRYVRLPNSAEPAVQSPKGIAVDDAYVYWLNSPSRGPTGSLVRVRMDGAAPPELLAAGLDQPDQIAVTSTAIYWTTFTGKVLRLAKP